MLFAKKKSPDFQVDVNENRNFVITDYQTGIAREIPYVNLIDDLKYAGEIKNRISTGCPEESIIHFTPEAEKLINELVESNRRLY